jgi:acetolactate decarboxylase
VPGYHFHFIAEDRTAGGHLLDCIADNVLVEIDYTTEFYMVLPDGGGFHEADLKKEKQRELEKVEYNK